MNRLNRTGVAALVIVSLTALFLTATIQPGKAQYSGTITIKADGTVEPSNAPIQRVGNNYTLTSDLGGISAERSNIVIDGNGFALLGIVSSIDSLGNNITSKNAGGVFLKNVENITVKNLIIRDSQVGISLTHCLNVTISGNTITGTYVPVPELQATAGIFVWGGGSHTISGNQIADNYGGIYLGYGTQNNVIVDNNITGNKLGGMSIWESSNNTIYRNRFINNTVQVQDVAVNSSYWKIYSFNVWDNGSQGNYWSDYKGNDTDKNGIGDTPYIIDENNQDRYPFMDLSMTPLLPAEETPSSGVTWIAASVVSAGVASAALIFYFKKKPHKPKTEKTSPGTVLISGKDFLTNSLLYGSRFLG
jgi:parallel beta-helix repeat protein